MTNLDDLRSRPGLLLETQEGEPVELRNVRGIVDPNLGRPDRPAAGDELVSVHVNHDPGLVNAYIEAHDPDLGPILYLHGFVAPSERLPQVYVLSDHRDACLGAPEISFLVIGSLDHPEVDQWPVFDNGLWEVQISIDPAQRQTRRMTIQFSRALALESQIESGVGDS
jgi:hypothetical protein